MSHQLYIVWTEKYMVGIPIIDEQHRCIVGMINSYHYLLQKGFKGKESRPFKVMMEKYAEILFLTERMLMEEKNYEKIDEHMDQQQEFFLELNNANRQVSKSGNLEEALVFAKNWWLDRIKAYDEKLIDLLKS